MKDELRKNVLTSLKNLSQQEEKQIQENNILQQLFNSELWQDSQQIGVTLSMPIEFNTNPIIKKALDSGKSICVPKTFLKGQMDFYYYDLTEPLIETKFGVLEPANKQIISKENIDLLIVPGVAFRCDGYRVGFGGGFYDRYLADFKGETCSLVFREQLVEDFQVETYDIAVNHLFTDNGEGEKYETIQISK